MIKKKERESGIELIKIFSILIIVITHVTQTLTTPAKFANLGFTDGFINLTATKDLSEFALIMMRYVGPIGNLIFIICTAYFLVDSKKDNKKKIAILWLNTLVISLITLAVFCILGVTLGKTDILESLLPITFNNNWFITTYILFCLIVPYLNMIIEKITQKQLFRLTAMLLLLYYGISFIKSSFYLNHLFVFIATYFVVCYLKKYKTNFFESKKNCLIILILGLFGVFAVQIITNILGLNFDFVKNNLMHFAVTNNPTFLMVALALFYMFKRLKFKNRFINSVASLSLYIYLIHENILVRNYTRVHIWRYIYNNFGFDHIVLKTISYAVLLFIAASFLSYIYKLTFEKITGKLIEKISSSEKINNKLKSIENKFL